MGPRNPFILDGGPAFPLSHRYDSDPNINVPKPGNDGMSLRDYFAAAALTGHIMSGKYSDAALLSEMAYEYADAMLAARSKKKKDKDDE